MVVDGSAAVSSDFRFSSGFILRHRYRRLQIFSDVPRTSCLRTAAGPRPCPTARTASQLGDVRLLQNPMVYYEVYVDLPAGTAPAYTSPHYIGNLDFFTSGRPGDDRISREFDLVMPFVRLSATKLWLSDRLDVTFVPRSFAERGNAARELGGKPQASIGSVSVVVE